MSDISPEEQKALFKQALQEWLDARYAEFGKWTMRGLLAAALAAVLIFLTGHGVKIQDIVLR